MSGLKRVYFEGKYVNINPSFYNFQTETVVMLTSAKNTSYSEVLIFILELLSEGKSDCHEILSGALVYGVL